MTLRGGAQRHAAAAILFAAAAFFFSAALAVSSCCDDTCDEALDCPYLAQDLLRTCLGGCCSYTVGPKWRLAPERSP